MDDLTKRLIEHLKRTSPGIQIEYRDTSAPIPVSSFNSIEESKLSTERDKHFQNAAKLLYEKLAQNVIASGKGLSDVEAFKQEQHTIIAQFAYDLIEHASECIDDRQMEEGMRLTPQYMIQSVPDLTKWPLDRGE